IVLRFNPDTYENSEGTTIDGCFSSKFYKVNDKPLQKECINETEWNKRWSVLKEKIINILTNQYTIETNETNIHIEKIFYNEGDTKRISNAKFWRWCRSRKQIK